MSVNAPSISFFTCFLFSFLHYVTTPVDLFLGILISHCKAQLICSWVFLIAFVNPRRCVPRC
jgi:hypothetical protein